MINMFNELHDLKTYKNMLNTPNAKLDVNEKGT